MAIERLSPALYNQIAAGEVVERPASVAKELLENAVDAGASHIALEMEDGGRRLLRVTDDGTGIPRADLPLALAAHATSKIHDLHDLDAIRTLGFRGEALASIASVSRLTLVSRHRGEGRAYSVHVEGPEQEALVAPAAHPGGTTVSCAELFFNTPARRRFLKSARTEGLKVREAFCRMAMALPGTAFTLVAEGRTALALPAESGPLARRRRVAAILGKEWQEALPLGPGDSRLGVEGFILPPLPQSVARGDELHLFLNGRPVADRLLCRAVKVAVAQSGGPSGMARAVLFLTCDPGEVDVNVHPRKDEVRFHHEREVHDLLLSCVARALPAPLDGVDGAQDALDLPGLQPLPRVSASLPPPAPRPRHTAQDQGAVAAAQRPGALPAGNPAAASEGGALTPWWEITPHTALLRLEGGFFLASDRLLSLLWAKGRYLLEMGEGRVPAYELLMPFALTLSGDEAISLRKAAPRAAAAGFRYRISGMRLSLLGVPLYLRGSDLATTARAALKCLAAGDTGALALEVARAAHGSAPPLGELIAALGPHALTEAKGMMRAVDLVGMAQDLEHDGS
ncbi:MAG: DNA mismatch repair endonuclease MutL [Succinivibrionaceae bacterium]|nr:DNA mismatch repair endonuclease MutL [Succinivibrionaceae bacterium]